MSLRWFLVYLRNMVDNYLNVANDHSSGWDVPYVMALDISFV